MNELEVLSVILNKCNDYFLKLNIDNLIYFIEMRERENCVMFVFIIM